MMDVCAFVTFQNVVEVVSEYYSVDISCIQFVICAKAFKVF